MKNCKVYWLCCVIILLIIILSEEVQRLLTFLCDNAFNYLLNWKRIKFIDPLLWSYFYLLSFLKKYKGYWLSCAIMLLIIILSEEVSSLLTLLCDDVLNYYLIWKSINFIDSLVGKCFYLLSDLKKYKGYWLSCMMILLIIFFCE